MKRRGVFTALFGLPVVAAAPTVAAPREVRLRLSVDCVNALREQMRSLGYAEPYAETVALESRLTAERVGIIMGEQTAALVDSAKATAEAVAALRAELASLRLTLAASRAA